MVSPNKIFSGHSCRMLSRCGMWWVGGTSLAPTGGVVRLGPRFPESWWPISCYSLLGPWLGSGGFLGPLSRGWLLLTIGGRMSVGCSGAASV